MFYLSDFCHLCLKDDKYLVNLSESLPENNVIKSKLNVCVSEVKWSASKKLLICRLCLQKLEFAYDFKQTCIKSDGILENHLKLLREHDISKKKLVKANLQVVLSRDAFSNKVLQKYISSQDSTNKSTKTLTRILDQSLVYTPTTSFIIANGQPISYQNIFLNFVATNPPVPQTNQPVLLNVGDQGNLSENDAILKHLLEARKPEEVSVEIDPTLYDYGHFLASSKPVPTANIECTTCAISYTTIKLLRRHFNEVHDGILPYKCTHCFSKFLLKEHYDKHMKNHLDNNADTLVGSTVNLDNLFKFPQNRIRGNVIESDLKCDQCTKVCISLNSLEKHITDVHNKDIKRFYCDVCKAGYFTEASLEDHMKIHKKSKVNKKTKSIEESSSENNKVAVEFYDLTLESTDEIVGNSIGLDIVDEENKKKIENCVEVNDLNTEVINLENDNLDVNNELNDNGNTTDITMSDAAFNEYIIDSPDGKFICSFCKRVFGRKHDLRRHINNVHVKATQYICHLCGEAFYEGFRLTRHLRCHYSSLSCSECHRIFSSLSETTNHMLTVHRKLGNAECNVCYVSFRDVHQLKLHMDMHMMEIVYKCHICKEEFRECRELTKHVSEHNGMKSCDGCTRMFYKEEEYLQHKETCNTAQYKCEICPRAYKKKRYLQAHIKSRHAETCVDEPPQKKKCKIDDI